MFKNFYAGGLGSVRGFEQNSLGPRDTSTAGQPKAQPSVAPSKAIFNAVDAVLAGIPSGTDLVVDPDRRAAVRGGDCRRGGD